MFAHIGKIPVEEYAGFIVPVILLYVYGRQRFRRERKALARLPGLQALDERTTQIVLASWAKGGHGEVPRELLPLMYPPGPDGADPRELAERTRVDAAMASDGMEQLADLGYLELDADRDGSRGWLTLEGIDLLNVTEAALLAALDDVASAPGGTADTEAPPPPRGADGAPLRSSRLG